MMQKAGVVLTMVSTVLFPWPLTVGIALLLALFEPWVPLAAGMLMDTLYFVPHGGAVPLFALCGALTSAASFFVRSRLKTSIILE